MPLLPQRVNSTLCERKFNYKYKKYYANLAPEKCFQLFKSKFKIIDDDVKKEMIEETAGNLSASAIVGVLTLAGGGIAIFAHPIVGCIIIAISIFYGSCIKVFAGRFYDRKIKYKKNKSIEEQLLEALKNKNTPIIPYIRTETSKYGFIKLLSPKATDLLNNSKLPLSPKIYCGLNKKNLPSSPKAGVIFKKLTLPISSKSKTASNKIKFPSIPIHTKIIPE
ncbi:hypothetical protein N9O88_00925 [bacterium]|nr:hypothetical protein [bacterium]